MPERETRGAVAAARMESASGEMLAVSFAETSSNSTERLQ